MTREVALSLKYFKHCLISPPLYPGTSKPSDYLREMGHQLQLGTRNFDEVSEIVGEIVGSELVKVVIALCINTHSQEHCSSRQARKLSESLTKVYENKDKLVTGWNYKLNMERVAVGSSRNLDYLISAGKPKVTLQTEMKVASKYAEYRYKCVREYSPARLQELLFEEIEGLTGFIPVYNKESSIER